MFLMACQVLLVRLRLVTNMLLAELLLPIVYSPSDPEQDGLFPHRPHLTLSRAILLFLAYVQLPHGGH